MKTLAFRTIGPLALLLTVTSIAAEEWVKVTIKKAFISRATFEANRDVFTEPEFGWRVTSNQQVFMRGDLYGDYFLPKSKEMSLTLIEKDILSDDIVQTFPLDPTPGIKKFENGEDEFSIDVGPFFPDLKSGNDLTAPTQLRPGLLVRDSVSFRDQDMTDTFQTDTRLTLVSLDFPWVRISGSGCKSTSDLPRNLTVLDCPTGSHTVSIVAAPGSSSTNYTISTSANVGALVEMFDRSLEKQMHRFDGAYTLLLDLDSNATKTSCQLSGKSLLCTYINYRLGDAAARSRMETQAIDDRKEAIERAKTDLPQD
ncbi:MAG: hypothetical protein JNM27_09805 [Leptospirales bacterium]|nr:hypothetical protein [Leptospirales bacterium]